MKSEKTYKNLGSLYFFSCSICLSWVSVGMIYSQFNNASLFIANALNWESNDETDYIALSNSIINFGPFIPYLVLGLAFPKSSRRSQLMFADLLTVIGSCSIFFENIFIFMGLRIILGVAVGTNIIVIPLFIREMAPPDVVGKLGCLNKASYSLGLIVAYSLAFGLPETPSPQNNYWMLFFIIPVCFSTLRMLTLVFIHHNDSPKYYMLNWKDEAASDIVEKIYIKSEQIKILNGLKKERDNEKDISFKELFRRYKTQLFIGSMLYFSIEFGGNSVMGSYSTQILTQSNTSDITATRLVNLGIGALRLSTAFTASLIIDKFGKRRMYIVGITILVIALGLLSYSLQYDIQFLSRAMVLFYAFGVAVGLALINPIYVPEILPYKGFCLTLMLDSVCSTITVEIFPFLTEQGSLGLPFSILILAGFAFLALLFCIKFVKETKGLTMYEIYQLYTRDQGNLSSADLIDV